MATMRQKRAIGRLIDNRGNVSKSMIEAGYRPATAKNPRNLTKSQGFLDLCDEIGLTDDFLLKALHEDISAKPQNRKGELELGFKIKKHLKDDDLPIGNKIIVVVPSELIKKSDKKVYDIPPSTK